MSKTEEGDGNKGGEAVRSQTERKYTVEEIENKHCISGSTSKKKKKH